MDEPLYEILVSKSKLDNEVIHPYMSQIYRLKNTGRKNQGQLQLFHVLKLLTKKKLTDCYELSYSAIFFNFVYLIQNTIYHGLTLQQCHDIESCLPMSNDGPARG